MLSAQTQTFIEKLLTQPESDLVVNHVVDRYRKGLYTLIMITGLPGTGKSSTCFRLKELIVASFPNKKNKIAIIDSLADLARFAMESNFEDINIGICEEVSTLFPSRRAMAGDNVDLAKVLDTCRKKRIILVANAPLWPSIDSHMRAMGNIYVETLKIYKRVGIVISKFFRLQTNPGTGKTYTHTMLRNGREVKRMYTRMPNAEDWKAYEKGKDAFMKELYIKITKRAEKRDEKEKEELGIKPKAVIMRAPTQREDTAYRMRLTGMTHQQIADKMGISRPMVTMMLQNIAKKLNFASINVPSNLTKTHPEDNKITSEASQRKDRYSVEQPIVDDGSQS